MPRRAARDTRADRRRPPETHDPAGRERKRPRGSCPTAPPAPQPAPGQVRVGVRAAGVNFADVMARVGMYPDAPPLPGVLGYEVSGEIDLPIDRAGEKVIALTKFGGQSEMVCVPASAVVPMPSGLSFAEAASIPVVWLTAWHMLVELGNLRRGHVVLIHAAAGGVGTAAVQICRKFGATSIGTASSGKHERLRELGLSHAIDYRKLDFEPEVKRITGGSGVDIALDPVGKFRKGFRCLAPVGRLMMYGASATVSGERRNLFAALGTVLKMRWFHPLQLLPDNKGIFGVNMGQLWGETELLAREMRAALKALSAGE